jgi:hypothetical protein
MRVSLWGVALAAGWMMFWGLAGSAAGAATCRRAVLEGAVRAGEEYVRPLGNGLEVMLEPLASGWILRVLPVSGPRPAHDYAELATPPYQSVSPLLISTDYSFRAQDVVAWNPRRFHYAASARDFAAMSAAYLEYMKGASRRGAVEAELADLASRSPEGQVEILDSHFVPGMANQAQTAAMVASHLSMTPHSVDQAGDGKGSALGRVTWIKFRISMDLPAGFQPAKGLIVKTDSCK